MSDSAKSCCCCTCIVAILVIVICVANSFSTVPVNAWGLDYSSISKTIDK